MTSAFGTVLTSLIRHRGVTGCMVVGEQDGIIVDSSLQIGVNGTAFAALTASLYRRARRSAAAAGFGETGFFELDAEHGRVCAAGRNDLVLVVVAGERVNVGLVRVEMLKALEVLS
ncbi:MAG TPA: roadblock/LC7 domain-containing protein [Gemmatimonadaceae bacterium]|nr:roadblock/LC7 domain-containing protein [Gemmatimonadaceae bacterium]